ncbi:MAG: uroporphyrinogen III [Gammaproteobacteria bacterium]|nr:MAG: uroporphyrinogen III [Gammaproteobacteria bacterium]RLA59902.1 MAG: uroporphyrinogen III [Gammaproteobacteria bacterium]
MSDKEKKNIEYAVEAARKSAATLDEPVAGAQEPKSPAAANPARAGSKAKRTVAPRKASSAIAWLALLLVLALAGGAAWSVLEMQRREAALVGRVHELESAVGQKEVNLQELGDRWQHQLRAGLGELKDELAEVSSRQALALESVAARLAKQGEELARFSANDRESWLLAEAEYLLRLANQRLIMAGDTVAARALLSSADGVLRELDDVGLHDVRGAVAADLAAVRAVPVVDVEGIYLRLAALVEQAGKLVIFQLPERASQPRPDAAEDWQARLQQGYEDALIKLSDYIIIRRRDVPMQALMDPQWERLVRQNLRMLLEQAQVALLSANQSLYSESLQRAQHWVVEFFESDEAAARAMAREITQLTDLNVAVTMPDISRSLRALDDAIEQRLQQGGNE